MLELPGDTTDATNAIRFHGDRDLLCGHLRLAVRGADSDADLLGLGRHPLPMHGIVRALVLAATPAALRRGGDLSGGVGAGLGEVENGGARVLVYRVRVERQVRHCHEFHVAVGRGMRQPLCAEPPAVLRRRRSAAGPRRVCRRPPSPSQDPGCHQWQQQSAVRHCLLLRLRSSALAGDGDGVAQADPDASRAADAADAGKALEHATRSRPLLLAVPGADLEKHHQPWRHEV
mmetsp:Transcript_86610/g.249901  ORF Transcript_86610/g.249901 Transcript_86610/m.249901 type:complete len:232 (+) Transcript_86610:256-951(+)